MPETVAVVIPTFNSSVTIERALESVVGQTCLPTEVIVIDNASADDTVARVRTFASKYPRITWVIEVSPTNIGPGAARNRGWNLAKSDLIAFLDSDDSWHPEKLRLQGEIVRMFPESVLFAIGTSFSAQMKWPHEMWTNVVPRSLTDSSSTTF